MKLPALTSSAQLSSARQSTTSRQTYSKNSSENGPSIHNQAINVTIKFARTIVAFAFVSLLPAGVNAAVAPVTTKKLSDVLFYPLRDAPATTLSLNDTRVSSELKGILKTINVRVGDSVKQGDIVAIMDCQDYEISVTQASAEVTAQRARLKFARSRLEKVEQLSKKNNISEEEVEKRASNTVITGAEVQRLKASLKATKRAVEKCSIRAPFDAVVIEQLANLGGYLTEGSPVLRLLDRDNVEVSANVQEQDLEPLKQAKSVAFIANDITYPLTLRAILPLMDSRIRSYEVRLEFSKDKAFPGSAGRAQWDTPVAHVPAELLVRRKDLGIFLEVGRRAKFLAIPGANEGQPAALKKLPPGENRIIINGRFEVNDGDMVQPTEP